MPTVEHVYIHVHLHIHTYLYIYTSLCIILYIHMRLVLRLSLVLGPALLRASYHEPCVLAADSQALVDYMRGPWGRLGRLGWGHPLV